MHFFLHTGSPKAPGAPTVYENKAAVLTLQWEEGDNGNLPIDKFHIQYRKGMLYLFIYFLLLILL